MSSGVSKVAADRHQRILLELVAQPGNDVCADCKSKNPRWASHNLGIFICVHCAAIHRKMGTHISKIKSLTMDMWTKEQVEHMKNIGNIKSNAVYNPDETRNPPPTNMMEAERDSELEKYIRAKYEFRRFKSRPAQVAEQLLGPSRSASKVPPTRSKTSPSPSRPTSSSIVPASSSLSSYRSQSTNPAPASQPLRSNTYAAPSTPSTQTQPQATSAQVQTQKQSGNPLWDDLVSLQAPSANSTLPLQIASPPTMSAMPQQGLGLQSMNSMAGSFNGVAANPTGFNSLGTSLTGFNNLGASPAGFNSLAPNSTSFAPSMPYSNMTGSSVSSLGVPGMTMSQGSLPNFVSGANPYHQGLQPPSSFTGPSSVPTYSPMNGAVNGMQSNPFGQQQLAGMPTFSQPQAGLSPYPQQQFQPQMSPMLTGAQLPYQPQPQSFSPMPQQYGGSPQPPFASTPSPIPPAGMGQQFQQPGWNAGQPGYAGGQAGQWGAM